MRFLFTGSSSKQKRVSECCFVWEAAHVCEESSCKISSRHCQAKEMAMQTGIWILLSISLPLMSNLPAVILRQKWIKDELHNTITGARCSFYGIETMYLSGGSHHPRQRKLRKKLQHLGRSLSHTKMTPTCTTSVINSAGCMLYSCKTHY